MLSSRETEIMKRIVNGQRSKEIAFHLGISPKTVATHLARLLKKLGLKDTRSLILYAARIGMIDAL